MIAFSSPGLDALATAVVFLDRAGTIEYANAAAENLLKLSARALLGHRLEAVFHHPAPLLAAVQYAQANNCGYTQHDLSLATTAAEKLEVTCTVTPAEIGAFDGFLLEFAETHQQLRIAREERLHDQTEASRALIRNLAHEIKNPLGGLRGAAQLLEGELDRPELTEYTQVIMKEADRLQSLMDRLLTPSRMPQPAPLNILECLERVRSLLLAEHPEGLGIRRDYDVSLPPVLADKEQIIQALLNIGRNAAQAMKGRGEVVLRTRVARQITLARKLHRLGVMVQIADNGPGIPEALREKIFFPLVSGREGGTGLGLTIAQNFIHQHGGLIEVESEPGRTCFTILLPLASGRRAGERRDARKSEPDHTMRPVWIIDDDRSIRWVFKKTLSREDIPFKAFSSAQDALAALSSGTPQVVVSDIRMPGGSGLELLQKLKERHPHLPVIIMTAYSDLESAVAAFQGGAFEYLPKPFDVDHAVDLIRRAMEESLRQGNAVEVPEAMPEILGQAASMQEVFRAIGRLTQSHATVLINGESGTGKELVARALHRHSPRGGKPFIAINTAAIPKELLESELFGHERGAFTGAQNMRRGRFEQAEGGTLFLDEIGDMPPDLQTRLLRVLSDSHFYRVGGHQPIKANVRIIAATHQDLESRVKQGLFREDLFHRLNVIRVRLPALRERREDVPLLAKYFLNKSARELGVEPKRLTEAAVKYLMSHDFPGNVRQLENLCHWLTVMAPGMNVDIHDLPPELRQEQRAMTAQSWVSALEREAELALNRGEHSIMPELSRQFERALITKALAHTGGRRIEASHLLGMGRNTLTRKIQELEIEAKDAPEA